MKNFEKYKMQEEKKGNLKVKGLTLEQFANNAYDNTDCTKCHIEQFCNNDHYGGCRKTVIAWGNQDPDEPTSLDDIPQEDKEIILKNAEKLESTGSMNLKAMTPLEYLMNYYDLTENEPFNMYLYDSTPLNINPCTIKNTVMIDRDGYGCNNCFIDLLVGNYTARSLSLEQLKNKQLETELQKYKDGMENIQKEIDKLKGGK